MNDSGMARARMTDVARLAGVSLKSVSRVVNDEAHVSPALRARVEAAVAALSYVPDPAARSLAGTRTFTIGLLFDNPSPNYTMKVIDGAYRLCHGRGYHLRIDHLDSTAGEARFRADMEAVLRHGRTDGFVLTPPLTDDPLVLDLLEQAGIRYARLAPVVARPGAPTVGIDDAAAGAAVAQRLWDLGHRRIAMVNGPASHGQAGLRRAGFLARLHALDPALVVAEDAGGFLFEGGIAAGTRLLAAQGDLTAIFATNDDMAAGVMAGCAQAGRRVPGDISVHGFDDSWIALAVWPYLATVHQPIADMAGEAVALLLDRDFAEAPARASTFDFALVERGSIGPAPAC